MKNLQTNIYLALFLDFEYLVLLQSYKIFIRVSSEKTYCTFISKKIGAWDTMVGWLCFKPLIEGSQVQFWLKVIHFALTNLGQIDSLLFLTRTWKWIAPQDTGCRCHYGAVASLWTWQCRVLSSDLISSHFLSGWQDLLLLLLLLLLHIKCTFIWKN